MTARNGAFSSTYSAATNRKSSTRNSTLCTVSLVVTTSTANPRMNADIV
jgi:hypothetical protein